LYNAAYRNITEEYGFNLHTIVDPTADIDVNVFYDPATTTREKVHTALFDIIEKKVQNIQHYLKKHLEGIVSTPPPTQADYTDKQNDPIGRYKVIDPVFIVLAMVTDTTSRIRINVQIGKFADHIMEFCVYEKLPRGVPNILVYGFKVRDIFFEILRNIGTLFDIKKAISEGKEELSSKVKIKIHNHIHRFMYGYKLFDILMLKGIYQKPPPEAYMPKVYSTLFNNLITFQDSSLQFDKLIDPYFGEFLRVLYTCPKSKAFLDDIISTVTNLKIEANKTPGANITPYDNFLTTFEKCTTAGGRRFKKRRLSRKRRLQKTKKRGGYR
jgi:predicted house-cleaning noncanonical NTP pyrophosphatase (MazG superfamily)